MKPNSCAGSEGDRSFPTMTGPAPLSEHQCLGHGIRARHQMSASHERDGGIQAASPCRKPAWPVVKGCSPPSPVAPDRLRRDAAWRSRRDPPAGRAPGFFSDFGWGTSRSATCRLRSWRSTARTGPRPPRPGQPVSVVSFHERTAGRFPPAGAGFRGGDGSGVSHAETPGAAFCGRPNPVFAL
jgi:hypothetical protein